MMIRVQRPVVAANCNGTAPMLGLAILVEVHRVTRKVDFTNTEFAVCLMLYQPPGMWFTTFLTGGLLSFLRCCSSIVVVLTLFLLCECGDMMCYATVVKVT